MKETRKMKRKNMQKIGSQNPEEDQRIMKASQDR
jgi:hypothetical protein